MTNEQQLKKLCDIWIDTEATPDTEDELGYEAELKPVGFILEHAGRYSLEMRPRDFFPDQFSNYSRLEDSDEQISYLYSTLTSPDENYYFGVLKLYSRHAYDVALLGEALRNNGPIDGIADSFALVFESIKNRDYNALNKALTAGGIILEENGSMIMNDIPNIVGSFTVFPII